MSMSQPSKAEKPSRFVTSRAKFASRFDGARFGLTALRVLLALLFLMPLMSVLYLTFVEPAGQAALPRYALNSILLIVFVGLFSGAIGLLAAVLVVRYEFAGRKWLESLLILPLALPAFLVAYALVEFFDYAGPLQVAMRDAGITWALPKFRSLGGAVLVFSFVLYPYVYIYARQGLLRQSRHVIEAARVMGLTPARAFWRVELPALRPALSIGLSLVSLEVLADFGTVDHFGVETLSTGIFSAWLQAHQLGSAVRIALVLALASLALLALESHFRRNASYVSVDGRNAPYPRQPLGRFPAILAWGFAVLVVGLGFALPIGIFVSLLDWGKIPAGEWQALGQSIGFGLMAASLVVLFAVLANQPRPSRPLQIVAMTGYALPGAVLGLGVLLPLSGFDQHLANWREALGAERAGLILTGSGFALVLAYFIRFFALGNGAILEGASRISPNLVSAARVLGASRWQAFWRVTAPAMKRPLMAAFLLLFVDVIKELPATLILRPFGVETLATRLYEAAALEDLSRASLSALLIAATGTLSVFVLNRVANS